MHQFTSTFSRCQRPYDMNYIMNTIFIANQCLYQQIGFQILTIIIQWDKKWCIFNAQIDLISKFIKSYYQNSLMMSSKEKIQKNEKFLKPSLSNKNLESQLKNQQTYKLIQRKPMSAANSSALSSKNSSKQHNRRDNNPRYIPNSPIKLVPFIQSITNQSNETEMRIADIKTERKQLTNEKSVSKSAKSKRFNEDSSDYYKYWKKKANQYQEMNFTLHRLNCSLQEQNEVLKHKYERLQKKLIKMYEPETPTPYDQSRNYEKLENYYKMKVEQMAKKIEQQKMLIGKQQKKIKQLSKYISQNYHLKNILDNMEEKVSELRSIGSRDSRADSMEKMSEKGDANKESRKKMKDYFEVEGLSLNKAAYSIDRNKKSENFNYSDHKAMTGRKA